MKVVLLQDIPKVGKRYEVKNLADGYALNFLIPRGLVETATKWALKKAEVALSLIATERKVQEDLLAKNIKSLENVKILISAKANEKGHLFAAIHKDEIVKAVKEQTRIDLLSDFISLDKPLKEIGEHIVEIKVKDQAGKIIVVVTAL